jgi:hypothetical protein
VLILASAAVPLVTSASASALATGDAKFQPASARLLHEHYNPEVAPNNGGCPAGLNPRGVAFNFSNSPEVCRHTTIAKRHKPIGKPRPTPLCR